MSFRSELARGRFCIPECAACRRVVWPASEICSRCMGPVSLRRGSFEGRILEYSGQGGRYFCMVEFEGGAVRVMAEISQAPRVGQAVRMRRCAVASEGDYRFHVE